MSSPGAAALTNMPTSPDFRAGIEKYIRREARPVDKFGHQPRLYALTLRIGEELDYDDDVVFAAAWLHDLGVFAGHRPEDIASLTAWDNVAYAMRRAPEVLREAGFPMSKIDAVVDAIRTHQPGGNPASVEGIILRDADILEQLGAIGILRTASKVGRDTRFPGFTSVAEALKKAVETLPSAIRLESTRAIAAPRILALQLFLSALAGEAQPELF
jgi:uncharacterized protein